MQGTLCYALFSIFFIKNIHINIKLIFEIYTSITIINIGRGGGGMDQNRQVDTITIGDVKNIGRRYTPSVWHYSIHDKTAGVLKDITEGGINIYLQSHGFIYTSTNIYYSNRSIYLKY